jgi:ParB family chromosome partitioning protein
MSKADKLGAGRFGGPAVSARRQAVAAATGVPTHGVAPPTELPVHRISLNPDNPRSALGDLTDLAGSLKTHGQKQAITVMNRDAYVTVNPQREADLEPDTTHVVIDGSSRLAAAREAGLRTIKIMVSDDQGSTSEELLESALVANIHRQDLEELDEARALQRLLAIHGSQTALAKRLHRSQGWVSQRLALLNLAPELQARIGHEPIDLLRAVGNKPQEQQQAALAELKADRERKEAEKQQRRPGKQHKAEAPEDHTGTANGYYDVIEGSTRKAPATLDTPVGDQGTQGQSSQNVPEPRNSSTDDTSRTGEQFTEQRPPRPLPYDDPAFIAMHLMRKMEEPALFEMLQLLNQMARERNPGEFQKVLSHFDDQPAAQSG